MARFVENTHTTKIIVAQKSWQASPRGERIHFVQMKAIIIKLTWDVLKDESVARRERLFYNMLESINDTLKDNGLVDKNNAVAMSVLEHIYKNSDHMRMLKHIEEYLNKREGQKREAYHLRFAEEKDVCDAVDAYIQDHLTVTSTSYVDRLIYSTHMAFFCMGREYDWGESQVDIKLRGKYNIPVHVMNGSNPMTQSSLKSLKKKFKDEIKETRTPRYSIEDDDGESLEINKHSKPTSLVVVFYVMTTLFGNILTNLSCNQVKVLQETENWVNVLMLYMFLIHEGGRPGDTLGWRTNGKTTRRNRAAIKKGQHHDNIWFCLNGKKYEMLVLSFLRPEQLATLIRRGAIKRYVCEFWKGKQVGKAGKGEYRARVKSLMPFAYNVLDLATMYVVLMRIKLCIAKDNISSHIFKKGQNISDDLKKHTTPMPQKRANKYNSVDVRGLTAYSIRYAAAEEEVRFQLDTRWTRFRMGHSFKSEMSKWYSHNFNQRVVFGDVENFTVKLAWESNQPTDINGIPMLFQDFDYHEDYPDNIIDDIDQQIITDMDNIQNALKDIIDGTKKIVEVPELLQLIPKDKFELCKELKMLPMGSHFKFEAGLLPEVKEAELVERLAHVHTYFASVEAPEVPQKVWAFPHVMWGEWNPELKDEVSNSRQSMYLQQLKTQLDEMAEQVGSMVPTLKPVAPPVSKKRQQTKVSSKKDKHMPTEPTEPNEADKSVKSPKKTKKTNDLWCGRVVAIICPNPGTTPEYEFRIPGTQHFVWIGLVTKLEILRNNVTVQGRWYTGETTQNMVLSDDVSVAHTVKNGLVHWWEQDETDRNRFSIAPLEFPVIAKHINEHFI